MKKLLLACALLSTSTYALKIEIGTNLTSKTFYKKMAKNDFIKSYSLASGNVSFKFSDDGETMLEKSEDVSQRDDKNAHLKRITVTGKNTIQYVDKEIDANGRQENIDIEINAKMKKSFTGNLKELTISKEELLAIYKDELEQSGLAQLQHLNIDTDEFKISSDIQFSDMECSVDGDTLACTDHLKMTIEVSDEL
ncbi:hypothetical protein [Bacteriovorax sp. Seq25_V]|uniref:hypothetical protein n=1 Tax=Bacteriovorax sp. Seq25_V TaxID=1201288 RepID=UPI00038A17E7|nr:hypothetical protein [Bacteriovorax sp. Seq25_V]EQC43698.1 hypothetical protein M900_1382 [Bacteriovorax sp. Seq25_V]